MKRLLTTCCFILTFACFVSAQTEVNNGAQIEFEETIHDFGELLQGGDASTEFKFTNTGSAPLIIAKAKGSCGCTVPTWPRQPIAPGTSASVKVVYDSKRVGPINKSVTITSNSSNTPTVFIRIKGTIKAKAKQ